MSKILLIYLSLVATLSFASVPSEWLPSNNGQVLIIDPSPFLTSKQKKLIFSGLPAYSSAILLTDNGDELLSVKKTNCAVQYDLWDEKIKLLYSKGTPSRTLKDVHEYYNLCLSFRLKKSPQVGALLANTKGLKLRLSLTQISGQTTEQIKEWLVDQQSSVLKGLFSHMLGDLKLEESQILNVDLPNHGG